MALPSKKLQDDLPDLIANRYRVEETIGEGGMAIVYKVHDISINRHVALKQLNTQESGEKQNRITELFEREFHTLSHLSHPRMIAVYDYGLSEFGPFYTMELLDGGDLRSLSPVKWDKACKLLLDICSALSLLHSRRIVHRDLSPRNIRCTSDGLAKLIDFGAMIPMGPCKQTVGTPPFVAPEVVNLQTLDGRTDLYSLGATLYYTLTGRNAFPARNFNQLPGLWRVTPLAPSEYAESIPKALDTLVMQLIDSDPHRRPVNAAEVMERLSAIANVEIDDELQTTQAYLSTPNLVGRERNLVRVRKRLIRAQRGRGKAILVRGIAGVGRSRFIDACVLEGKLMGAIVIRADATDAQTGEYGVVRELVRQLFEAAPEVSFRAAEKRTKILAHALPELQDKCGDTELHTFGDSHQLRTRFQRELRAFVFEVSAKRPILIAVDDFHRIDETSAAFLAFLSYQVSENQIVEVISAETGAPSTSESALRLIADTANKIELNNLSAPETTTLLRSVFGDVPYVQLVADRLHRISEGNPRDLMQLTQFLVDNKLVRCHAGAWLLPDRIDADDLPANVTQALAVRLERLSEEARHVVETIALDPEQSYTFEECLLMTDRGDASQLTRILDELVASDILRINEGHYTYKQQLWAAAFKSKDAPYRERERHLRLAEIFRRRGQEQFRVARHLLLAGETDRGLDALVAFSVDSRELTAVDNKAYTKLILSTSSDVLQTFIDAIELCKRRNRSRADVFKLQTRLSGLAALINCGETAYIRELIQRLYQESGLGFYHELDDALDPSIRLTRALELAQARYDGTEERDRGLPPGDAIRQLARTLVETSATVISSLDYAFLKTLPSLEPFVPLSPALGVVDKLVNGLGNRIAGRNETAIKLYKELLERTAQPDRAGLDDSHHKHSRFTEMRGIGLLEAVMGLESALQWASEIETDPLYQVSGLQIRSLYYLWQGDNQQANRYSKQTEWVRIQVAPVEVFPNTNSTFELAAYALTDDLSGVKHLLSPIQKLAEKFPAWIPILHWAQGEYQRIRGDYASALSEFNRASELTAAGWHQNWAHIISAKLRTLLELEHYQEAERQGHDALCAAETENLGYLCHYIRMPFAVAQAKLGKRESAEANCRAVIQHFERLGTTGINLGVAHETAARVALFLDDQESYEKYLGLYSEQLKDKNNPAVTAKFERLVREAQGATTSRSSDAKDTLEQIEPDERYYRQLVSAKMISCNGFRERAQCALKLLNEYSKTPEGFFYLMQKQGMVLCGQRGNHQPPKEMDAKVRAYLDNTIDTIHSTIDISAAIGSVIETTSDWSGRNGDVYRPVLLGHHTSEGYTITGLAVLLLDSELSFVYPVQLVGVLSEFALASGDVSTFIAY